MDNYINESIFEDESQELVELVFNAIVDELSGVQDGNKRTDKSDFVSVDLTDRDGMWHVFFTGSQRNYIRSMAFAEGVISGLCRVADLSEEMQSEIVCR